MLVLVLFVMGMGHESRSRLEVCNVMHTAQTTTMTTMKQRGKAML